MSAYPGALDTLDPPPGGLTHADVAQAVEAVQSTLGVNPQGTEATVVARLNNVVHSASIDNMVALTQAAYDALGTPDANTFYVIVP